MKIFINVLIVESAHKSYLLLIKTSLFILIVSTILVLAVSCLNYVEINTYQCCQWKVVKKVGEGLPYTGIPIPVMKLSVHYPLLAREAEARSA